MNSFDGKANVALRAPNCRHTIIPAALGYAPHLSNEAYLEIPAYLGSVLSKLHITSTEMLETDRQIAIRASSDIEIRPDLRDAENDVWASSGELMFVLQFDEAGKIENIFEMLDSVKAQAFYPLMVRASKKLQGP